MRLLDYLSNLVESLLGIKNKFGKENIYDNDDYDNNNILTNNFDFNDIEYNYNPFGEFIISAIF